MHSWWQQARAHKVAAWTAEMFYSKSWWHRVTYCPWLCRAGTDSLGIPSRLLYPHIPSQRHCRKEEIPQLLPRTSHFYEMPEMKESVVRCVMVTTHCEVVTATRWVKMFCFFSQRIGFPDFLLFHFLMPNFPLQGAVQGLSFLQRADSKSSFIQEKMKPSLGILGLMQKHAGVFCGEERDLGNPGSSSSPYIFPSKKQMKGNCQS